MTLTVLASGSSGNGYLLQDSRGAALLLECGVPPERLFRETDCLPGDIYGCLVTHEHGDHARYCGRYAGLGLDIHASAGTLRALSLTGRRAHPLHQMLRHSLGPWGVSPFPVHHDAAEPMGFMVDHPELGRLLFVTDTCQVDYCFRAYAPAHILVEANWSDDVLDNNVLSGRIDGKRARRVRDTHLSLRAACDLVATNATPSLQTVTLIHLSDGNSDEAACLEAMRRTVPAAQVYAARKGLVIDLNPFDVEMK